MAGESMPWPAPFVSPLIDLAAELITNFRRVLEACSLGWTRESSEEFSPYRNSNGPFEISPWTHPCPS